MLTLTPVYIICADSVVEDRITGRASILNVVEKISFSRNAPRPNEPRVLEKFKVVVSALWRAEPAIEEEIENEFLLVLPHSHKKISLSKNTFRIMKGRPLCRFNLLFEGAPPLDGAGLLEFQHRVKVPGSEWQTQSFPVTIEEIKAAETSAALSDAKN